MYNLSLFGASDQTSYLQSKCWAQTNTLILLNRKFMFKPCLFICQRNLSSKLLGIAVAFSGIIIIIVCRARPWYKPMKPLKKLLLVLSFQEDASLSYTAHMKANIQTCKIQFFKQKLAQNVFVFSSFSPVLHFVEYLSTCSPLV